MKKWKLFAATVLSAATLLTSIWTVPVYAEEGDVTEKPYISADFSNKVGEKKIAKEDAEVINEFFGYKWGSNTVNICGKDTTLWIDIENSLYGKNIYKTAIYSYLFSRDENGKLQIELNYDDIDTDTYRDWKNSARWNWNTETNAYDMSGLFSTGGQWEDGYYSGDSWCEGAGSYFSLNPNTSDAGAINTHLGDTSLLEPEIVDEVYIISVEYLTEGSFEDEDYRYGWADYWILPEGVETVLHLEDIEEEPAPSEEQYVVDLTNSTEPISKENFATLLEENKTKDVVISSNNGVTFTFKAGTMTEVEGKEAYDFSTSIQNTYENTMPSYVTANNFVSQINFNYSGTLPADAYIRFSVGTQYAGQTLYYSLMNEAGTFAEVQAVTVDAEGYITVKQNHCSSYVVTTENPETPTQTPETPSQPEETPEPTPESPSQPEQSQTPETQPEQTSESAPEQNQTQTTQKTSPKTGETFAIICVFALVSVSAVVTAMFGKKRSMR